MTNENRAITKTEQTIRKLRALMDSTFEIPRLYSFVKPAQLHELLQELEQAVQEDMEYTKSITVREKEIIEAAEKKAEEMLKRRQRELESQDIVKQAQIYAKQIAAEAQRQAKSLFEEGQQVQQHLIENGHKYVDKLLLELEDEFRAKSEQIAKNRLELNNSLEEKMKKMDELSI